MKGKIVRSAISSYTIYQIREKQKDKCAMCKSPLEKNRFHLDHITPLSKGGKDEVSNYQILCFNCHSKKTSKEQGVNMKYRIPEIIGTCNQCGKVIEGYTQKQVDYMMAQHNLAKHKEEEK